MTLMLGTALIAGCAESEADLASSPAAPATEAASEPSLTSKATETADDRADDGKAGPAQQRKLIQTGELRLEVSEYADARAAIDAALRRVGGFVADADVQHRDGKVSRATLTLRIPQKHFHAFLRGAADNGTVLHEALHTTDVTDVYVDTAARLKNARRLEARMIQLLDNKTDGVKDLLEVERELARVREQIERYEGRLKSYDKQVGLSTLKLELATRQVYAAAKPATLGERVANTFGGSLATLGRFGRGLLLLLVALVPWLLPLLLIGWLAYRGVRWLGRKGREAREAALLGARTAAAATGVAQAAAGAGGFRQDG